MTTITAKCIHPKTLQCITHTLGCAWICEQQQCECPGKIVCALCRETVQELQPEQIERPKTQAPPPAKKKPEPLPSTERGYWSPTAILGHQKTGKKKAISYRDTLKKRVESFAVTAQTLTENQRLMKARADLGLTQRQFADLLGVPLCFITQTVERPDQQGCSMDHHRSKANPRRIKARAWLEIYEKQTELAMSQGEQTQWN
jgi:DNA-binding transcriptional regulator YiaG